MTSVYLHSRCYVLGLGSLLKRGQDILFKGIALVRWKQTDFELFYELLRKGFRVMDHLWAPESEGAYSGLYRHTPKCIQYKTWMPVQDLQLLPEFAHGRLRLCLQL